MNRENGYTIVELMVVLVILTVLSATALYNLRMVNRPLYNASSSIEHFLHLSRSRAISGTSVIRITAASANKLVTSTSTSCTGTMTAQPTMFLDLPAGSWLDDTTTAICFTQRGLAAESGVFSVVDDEGKTARIRVALGGGTAVE